MAKKVNILLDLDQTLISAEPLEEYDMKKNMKKSEKFTSYDMEGYYIVFERPKLQTFLTYLFDNFNVSIWTAATKDYALFVIDKIITSNHPERKIDYLFFSYHCDVSKDVKSHSKDLSMLWDVYKIKGYTKGNTVILDDYDEVHKSQPDNCIIAEPFEYNAINSEKDKFLDDLTIHLRSLTKKVDNGETVETIVKAINKK